MDWRTRDLNARMVADRNAKNSRRLTVRFHSYRDRLVNGVRSLPVADRFRYGAGLVMFAAWLLEQLNLDQIKKLSDVLKWFAP